MDELTKLCRVCLSEGSREIFNHRNQPNIDTVSSLDRIVEKLRFVTMLKIHEADCLPEMICDSCIIQLNVAYNFKKRAIESDTKLRQYIIEKGIGPSEGAFNLDENGYNLAITDGHRGSSVSTYLNAAHSLCDFAVPEPLRQLHPDTTVLAHEYLRNFETPQSMNSNIVQPKAASSSLEQFRCMPIQIKVEFAEDNGNQPSPVGSEDNLQTVSDTSSILSAANRINGAQASKKVAKQPYDHLAHCSDEEFINHYLRPSHDQKNGSQKSDSDKSPASSKSTGTSKSSATLQTTMSNKTNSSATSNVTALSEKGSMKSSASTNVPTTVMNRADSHSFVAPDVSKRKREEVVRDPPINIVKVQGSLDPNRKVKIARRELLSLSQNDILQTSRSRARSTINPNDDESKLKQQKTGASVTKPEPYQSNSKSRGNIRKKSEDTKAKSTNKQKPNRTSKKSDNAKKNLDKNSISTQNNKMKAKKRALPTTTSHAKVALKAGEKQKHKKSNKQRS